MAVASSATTRNLPQRLRSFFAKNTVREEMWALVFVAPYLVHLLLLTAGPIVVSFFLSFTEFDLYRAPEWIGLDNYIAAFGEERTIAAFRNTGYYVLFFVPASMFFSLLLALGLNQRIRGIYTYRSIFFLPVVSAGVATAILWQTMFNKFGVLNGILGVVGLGPILWLGFDMALNSIIIMSVWQGVGILIMYWLAGLQGIPQHLYEAADIDGAGRFRKFWHVTLPMLTPFILLLMILGIIGSFQVFTATFVITGGGPGNATLTLGLLIYYMAFQFFRMGYAAALSYLMFVAVFTITMTQWYYQKHWVHYE